MNLDVKEKWVAALRSGAYTQGRMSLRYSAMGKTKYCCLGVLCDVEQCWKEQNNNEILGYSVARRLGLGQCGIIPDLKDRDGDAISLVNLNDDEAGQPGTFLTFSQIADVIEYFF